MSATGLGRVKTPTFNLRAEIPSRFCKFENQKWLRPPLGQDDRENNSAHSWLVHVFTQPGSKGDIGDGTTSALPLPAQPVDATQALNLSAGVPTAPSTASRKRPCRR